MDRVRVSALVLAAGASERFGGVKTLARLGGRPVLQHVLDTVAAIGFGDVVVVLGDAPAQIEAAIGWRGERRVCNPDPGAGLSSSLRVGMAALAEGTEAALVLLGDQPLVRADVIEALLGALRDGGRPVVVPRYAGGGGANPVLIARAAWPLALGATGDRGLGPVLRVHPELVHEVAVLGANPDVDTRGDLAALEWAERVRANREQVDRVREVPDDPDFYAPLTARFRDDPRRSGDDVLDVLRSLVRPGETWLDIGAGAGRYALPIALLAREVIAVDASAGMLAALRESMAEHGIGNVRIVHARWPLESGGPAAGGPDAAPVGLLADVALIANVGYDIEAIGSFLDAMEASARRMCVAVLMDRQPASIAEQFWPAVHGEARVPLPGLPEFLDLLHARGASPALAALERAPRGFPDEETLVEFIRRQLWVAGGGAKDRLLRELIRARLVGRNGGVGLRGQHPSRVAVVHWGPGDGGPGQGSA